MPHPTLLHARHSLKVQRAASKVSDFASAEFSAAARAVGAEDLGEDAVRCGGEAGDEVVGEEGDAKEEEEGCEEEAGPECEVATDEAVAAAAEGVSFCGGGGGHVACSFCYC